MEGRPSILRPMVVPELLTEHNYKTWRVHMKCYLSSEGLWGIVSGQEPLDEGSSVELNRRNAAALRAILMSCGTEAFGKIETAPSAKYAWEVLLKWSIGKDGYESEEKEEDPTFKDSELLERGETVRLINAIREGDLASVRQILNSQARRGLRISKNGYTALHAAISTGPQHIVSHLIGVMSEDQLEIRDKKKRTALSLAAYHGKMETAQLLIHRRLELIGMKDGEGNLPLLAACQGGHVEMALFLWHVFSNIPPNDIHIDGGADSESEGVVNDVIASFFQACIEGKMFAVAWRLLEESYDRIRLSENHWAPHLSLAEVPSAFPSGSRRLVFWQQWIYNRMTVEPLDGHRGVLRASLPEPDLERQGSLETPFCKMLSLMPQLDLRKHIYEPKLTHTYASEILRHLGETLSTAQHNEIRQVRVVRAMFSAIKNGIVEFVKEIIETSPDIIWMLEEGTSRDMLMCAIAYRQEKIASFIYELDEWRASTVNLDKDRNNLLHMVGKLAPDFQLSRIPGAALQMQRELQWFKEVESIVPEYCKESKNDFKRTPGQVFSEEHKDLQRKAEDWMKQTASSYTVVGALIITVMFAAAFTVPGGNNQDTGFPMFLPKTLFKIFIISDAISLSAASTSVLMFLQVLTSRYAEEDFLTSLPSRLIIGRSTLLISIAMMMVAFSTALVIMLKGRLWIIIVMVVLSCIPIGLFASHQYPLLVEIYNSTYRWKVFKKKRC